MNTKANLLVVDDELIVRDSLDKWFREEGYDVAVAESAHDALAKMAAKRFDLALVDIKMPGTDGVELQRRMHEIDPDMLVIIMTGYASVETAVAALKNGAYDYVSKPFDPDDIAHAVHNALSHQRMKAENERLRETVASVVRPQELVGQSSAMIRVFEAIQTVGPTDATVLITGESGTGKELCARAIHAASPRHYNPLVVIHCGALTETLLESELFGHEKGAFTGAQYRKKGSFEVADGGTVFLDEIGELSIELQAKLLRALQEKEVRPVGATHTVPIRVRIVAATNRDLAVMVEQGSFRKDLYYRLNVVNLKLPPLRNRREDIPLLAAHFLDRISRERGMQFTLSDEALRIMMGHDWPGNVRELENAMQHGCTFTSGPVIQLGDLSTRLKNRGVEAQHTAEAAGDSAGSDGVAKVKALAELEREAILDAIRLLNGDKLRAAKMLGIGKTTLYRKLKEYGIVDPLHDE